MRGQLFCHQGDEHRTLSGLHGTPAFDDRLRLRHRLLEVAAAVLWGATTLYIKKYLAESAHPINTFIYQLLFSIPIMIVAAYFLEPVWVTGALGEGVLLSIFYQSVIVAFASYLTWFKLIHTYPVASLSVFTFLTPVFGVASGVIFLGEDLTSGLVIGLICVSAGIDGTSCRRRPT